MTTSEVSIGTKRKAEGESEVPVKKVATSSDYDDLEFVKTKFSSGLFDDSTRDSLKTSIAESSPYKHGVIPALMDDGLLRKVREEIMANLHFTKKETDIYKVFQTGDLRNLSGLDEPELSKLSSLYQLRQALYSKPFREHLAYVTGSGALSGTKQDLSINVYQQGCHLLNHDDVIGSRRISYILYLPDPDEAWEWPKNGGALRLYPTERLNVPAKDWTLELPPAWNQLAFFTVQPGLSFHDVEEVFVNKPRLSISGWFHIPQKGEEGFIEGELEENQSKSSLQQLESDELQEYDFPKRLFVKVDENEVDNGRQELDRIEKEEEENQESKKEDDIATVTATETGDNLVEYLSSEDIAELSKFINPGLLRASALRKLTTYFLTESAAEIRDFLNTQYAGVLKRAINGVDMDDETNGIKVPFRSTDIQLPWKLAGPPHKFRYMYLDGRDSYESEVSAEAKQVEQGGEFVTAESSEDSGTSADLEKIGVTNEREKEAITKLNELANFFKSKALRNWIRVVCRLNPIASRVLVRRFRPSLDYTLATGLNKTKKNTEKEGEEEEESIQMLEATLSLTPTKGWVDGELGGYELYLAVDEDEKDGDLDPAVVRGTRSKQDEKVSADGGDSYGKSSTAEEEDSVLLTTQAEWNVLSLVVRDEGILKFVKYVSGNAPGSRWDLSAEWRVEEGDDDDEDEDEGENEDEDEDEDED